MRFAIAALMSLFLIGTICAQASTSAPDTSQSPAAPAPAAPQASDQTPPAADQTPPAPGQGTAQTPAPSSTPPEAPNAPPTASPKSSFAFTAGVALGSDVLLTGPAGAPETWTRLGFQPDLSFGKIGIGFDLSIHFMLYPPNSNDAIQIYQGDWVPKDAAHFLGVYLPKIMYVRYGLKGEDPFFAKLGSIDDLSLGDGFIMSDYSNTLYLPQTRIFGLDVGLDGSLFNFQYAGIELLTGDLAAFDVVGGRVFFRPLVGTSIPILSHAQVGATLVVDRSPFTKGGNTLEAGSANPITAYGADIMVPLLGGKVFPLATFTDIAVDPNQTVGWMVGFAGRLISVFTYGAQLRILQNGFIPSYFDANYDVFSAQKYDQMHLTPSGGIYEGWFATLGTSLFTDIFVFNVALDGPFAAPPPTRSTNQTDYPHLRGVVRLNQIPKIPFYFDASYDKYFLGAVNGFFPDLVDPTDAVVGLDVNYKTGASVLTLAYTAKWNPLTSKFDVTSSLQASIQF